LQDILALGTSSRMNLPGTSSGNWSWRFESRMLTPAVSEKLKKMTSFSGRSP
jgi:4-alpha-glucanotransferase